MKLLMKLASKKSGQNVFYPIQYFSSDTGAFAAKLWQVSNFTLFRSSSTIKIFTKEKKDKIKGLMVFQINDLERTFLTEQQLIAGPDIKLTILFQPK